MPLKRFVPVVLMLCVAIAVSGNEEHFIRCDNHSEEFEKKEINLDVPPNYDYYAYDRFKAATFSNVDLREGVSYTFQCAGAEEVDEVSFQASNMMHGPGTLFDDLRYLRDVDLSQCHIQYISRSTLRYAYKLVKLNLSGNSIEQLEDMLFANSWILQTLDLSNNRISQIGEKAFDILVALSYLHLNGNKLKTLHSGVFESLASLNDVFLHNNELEAIQAGLFVKHSYLKQVFLHNNRITSVDEGSFRADTDLSVLALSNNLLTELVLPSVRAGKLLVSDNNLDQLHISSQTSALFAENNVISRMLVDNRTGDMKMEELHLRNNSLSSYSSIDKFKSLKTLDLSYNNLEPLGIGTFAKLKNLETVKLRQAGVSHLQHGTFAKQQTLRSLDLSYNELEEIDFDIFVTCRNVTELYLGGNRLTTIDYEHMKKIFPLLTKIGIDRNFFNCSFVTEFVRFCKEQSIDIVHEEPVEERLKQTNVEGIDCYEGTEPMDVRIAQDFDHSQPSAIDSDAAVLAALLQNVVDEAKRVGEHHDDTVEKQSKLEGIVSDLSQQQLLLGRDILEVRASLSAINRLLPSNRTANQTTSTEDLRRMIEGMSNATLAQLKLTEEKLMFMIVQQSFNVSAALALGTENDYKFAVVSKRIDEFIGQFSANRRLQQLSLSQSEQDFHNDNDESSDESNALSLIILLMNCLTMGVVGFFLFWGNRKSFFFNPRRHTKNMGSMPAIIEHQRTD